MIGDPRRRVFAPELHLEQVALDASEAHYLRDVLRLTEGEMVLAFDGRGNQVQARISSLSRNGASIEPAGPFPALAAELELTVGTAIPKGDRADTLVEKLSELGVAKLCWLLCERSVTQEVPRRRVERWRRLSLAASRQCGRAELMTIDDPVPLPVLLARPAGRRLVADPRAESGIGRSVSDGEVVVVIGPEGGLTGGELAAAADAGYSGVGLSRLTLRVETAAIAAAAMILNATLEHGG